MNYSVEVAEWLSLQRGKAKSKRLFSKAFVGARGYPHFDTPVSLKDSSAVGKLNFALHDSDEILKWQFLPFVTKYERTRKYRHRTRNGSAEANQKKRTHLKSRHIMIASHADACLYSFFAYLLERPYESLLDKSRLSDCVLAYRSQDGKNNVDFAKDVFRFIEAHNDVACLMVDISGFFDSVRHEILHNALSKALGAAELPADFGYIIENITHYRYVNQDDVIVELKKRKAPYLIRVPNGKTKVICKISDYNKYLENSHFIHKNSTHIGIPQGSTVSGILANISLIEFDEAVQGLLKNYNAGLYRRYSDDICIVCPSAEALHIYRAVVDLLNKLGLHISTKKTEAFRWDNGSLTNVTTAFEPTASSRRQKLQYLGLEWDGRHITIRPGTIAKRYRPHDKLDSKFWIYNKSAIRKTGDPHIAKQFARVRRTVKKFP